MHLSSIQLACAALVAVALGAAAPPSSSHHVARRSFFTLECKGVYDAAIFARLDRICDDCYNLFREPQLYNLCRKDCFTTDYFKGCVEVLQETDQLEQEKCFTSPYFKGCMESLYLYDEKEQIDQMIDFVGKR
uniref:SFRICE_024337 n=1 Tax=Spodoptera frugiperda TaxID=7108 RepID=A0A2H1WBV3_SPOFR